MNLFGYLDPGSSTLIIQAVLGGTAGAAVLFKTMGNKFKRKNKTDGVTDATDATEVADVSDDAEPNAHPQSSD
jgi:hypothetical protein